MKRISVALLVLVLFLGMLPQAMAAAGDAALVPPEGQGKFFAMASIGDTLYLLSDGGLYTWRPGDPQPSFWGRMPEEQNQAGTGGVAFASSGGVVIRSGGELIDHLLAWEGKLCGLDSDEGTLYLLEATDGKVVMTKLQSLKWDAVVQSTGDFILPGMVISPVVLDGYLYLIKSSMDNSGNELIRFSLSDGSYIKYDASLLADFAPYQAGKVLILQYPSRQDAMARTGKLWLNMLDLESGEIQKGLELPVASATALAYDPATDTAAFFSGGEIYAVDAMATCRLAGYAPAAPQGMDGMRAMILENGQYALCGEQVSVRSITKGQGVPRALRINNAMELSYQEFSVKRPDIPVVLKQANFDSAEMLMQDMAGGGSDLYCIRIDALDYRALVKKGYTAPMPDSGVLMEQVKEMYPFLQKELLGDGGLAAFPVSLSSRMIGYSKKALLELGITEEDLPHTFAELMAFITGWEDAYGADHPSLKLFEEEMYGDPEEVFFSWLLEEYCAYYAKRGEGLTFDTPLMEKLLGALEEGDFSALESKDVQQAMEGSVTYTYRAAGLDQPATALFSMYHEGALSEYGYAMNDFEPLPIALDKGLEPAIPTVLTVYVINPYSNNKDLALTYLEHFATQRSYISRAAMSPAYSEPVINARYEVRKAEQEKEIADIRIQLETAAEDRKKDLEVSLKSAQEALTMLESIKWQLSAQQLAAYRERAGLLSVNNINPLALIAQDQSMASLLGRYAAGQMSRGQLLSALEDKLQMVYRESK